MHEPLSIVSPAEFDAIDWHDSELLDLRIECASQGTNIEMVIRSQHDDCWVKKMLTFVSATYTRMDIDLEMVSLTGGTISSAACSTESELLMELQSRNEHDSFAGYLHFRFSLVPPGGQISVLSQELLIEEIPEEDNRVGK